jgi:hypothetical protein
VNKEAKMKKDESEMFKHLKFEHHNIGTDAGFTQLIHRQRIESLSVRFFAEMIPDVSWSEYDREISRAIDMAERMVYMLDNRYGNPTKTGGRNE